MKANNKAPANFVKFTGEYLDTGRAGGSAPAAAAAPEHSASLSRSS
jgi:hypothetical protein